MHAFAFFLLLAGQAPPTPYLQANNITQVVDQWTPDTHLYVIGALPETGDMQLRELAGWLKGKHWYVVLARSADGQAYTDVNKEQHLGVEAMDYALGRGIGHKPAFEALKHAKIDEKDGAVFGLYLDNRKLFLRTSEVHDNRGLSGEKNFAGNLDQWAKNAMRNQGPRGIVAAVKDTVANVDRLLNEKIDSEADASRAAVTLAAGKLTELERRAAAFRQAYPKAKAVLADFDPAALQAKLKSAQAALDAKQLRKAADTATPLTSRSNYLLAEMDTHEASHKEAQTTLAASGERLTELTAKAQAFVKAFPALTGDMTRLDFDALNAEATAAQAELDVNPARAKELAKQLQGRLPALMEAYARYPSAAATLIEEQKRLRELESRKLADAARLQLVEAKQALAEANKAYGQGDSSYLRLLARASAALDAAGRAIAEAENAAAIEEARAARAAASRRFFFWLFTIIASCVLAGTAFFMNRSARHYKALARKLLDNWNQALHTKLEVMQGSFDDSYRTWVAAYLDKSTGDTQRLVGQARVAKGWVTILWAMAQDRLKQVKALVEPGVLGQAYGLFLPGNYQRALGFEKEKVTFRPDDEALLRELFGKERTWEDKLLGNVHDYAPLEASFSELVQQLNANAKTLLNAVKEIENSVLGMAPKVEAISTATQELEAKQTALEQAGTDGRFLARSLFTKLVPAIRETCDTARATAKKDPVAGYKLVSQTAERMVREGRALADVVLQARTGALAAVRQTTQALQAQDIADSWLDSDDKRLSAQVDVLAEAVAAESIAEQLADLQKELSSLGQKAERAGTLAAEREHIGERTAQAREEVKAARSEISRRTGVAENRLLHEEGFEADVKLRHAQERANDAARSLGQGGLDAAAGQLEEAKKIGQQLSEILEISLAAAREYDNAVQALTADDHRISTSLPQHKTILDNIRSHYAGTVLKLGAGDEAHPNANGALADNIDEAELHLLEANEKLKKAALAFKEGRVLHTAELLNQAKANQELATHRLAEIAEKQTRLQDTERANRTALTQLRNKLNEVRKELDADARVMKATLTALESSARSIAAAADLVAMERGADPFMIHDELTKLAADLTLVHATMAANDRDVFVEAERSLNAADKQVSLLTRLVREATGDQVPDSEPLKTAARTAKRLDEQMQAGHARRNERHGDWNALDAEADRLAAEAAKVTALVKGEMEKAERAVAAISQAAAIVREAAGWAGSYGIRIHGAPGDELLDSARTFLNKGLYLEAERQAEAASKKAAKALEKAEAEVAAERERRRRIAEEERRKREAAERARRALTGTGGSSGSSSSTWSFGGGGMFGGGGGGGGSIFKSGGGSSSFGGFSSSGGGSSGW